MSQIQQHTLDAEKVGTIRNLQPESSGEVQLKPDTKVLVVNRGRETLFDTYDSKHYTIPPGFFEIEYGAAVHFKNRGVVPGSRNPETNFQASFFAIVGVYVPKVDGGFLVIRPVDHPHEWDPFTDAECQQYEHALETIDRGAMVDPIESVDEVQVKAIRGAGNAGVIPASRVKGGGGPSRSRKQTQISGDATGLLARKNAPGTNEAIRDIRADTAARNAEA